ncbi:SDR family oxidoreductase [Orrella marina]|uniref:3-oxoacyl-ACP reductase n=1 Tax=Orrella marina TaxID=2163011 RepID=A0A2R4XJD6_9BURK|nr:SDR family oxidoreductase [Orrella marina]AWB33819.1 3-oxoacyl-ACP reductase [Orrella marina]
MDLKLKDKHILITGGSKGIGLACAKAFLSESAQVTLVARDLATLESVQRAMVIEMPESKGRVAVFSADLRDPQSSMAALEKSEARFGPVDVLVNSAGAAKRTPAAELTPQIWRDALDAKFFTYINMIDPVVKRMAKRKQGVIINVIGAGGKTASAVHLAGGSANAALMLATAGLASAYGREGVRVVGVNPGPTHTERLQEGLEATCRLEGIDMDTALENATARIALGRLAEPEEIADTVAFLASDKASYISGVNINMDGVAVASVV